jgi:hypothetical protein
MCLDAQCVVARDTFNLGELPLLVTEGADAAGLEPALWVCVCGWVGGWVGGCVSVSVWVCVEYIDTAGLEPALCVGGWVSE